MNNNKQIKREPKEQKIIKLCNNLEVRLDGLNYSVYDITDNKNILCGHGANLESAIVIALRYVTKKQIKQNTLEEALYIIRKCKEELIESVKNIKIEVINYNSRQ